MEILAVVLATLAGWFVASFVLASAMGRVLSRLEELAEAPEESLSRRLREPGQQSALTAP